MSLEDLYKFGKLERHRTGAKEVRDLFEVAKRCLKDAAQTAISLDLRYVSAYQAALAAGEALVNCFGYKAPKNNYHYMTWEALRNILGKPFYPTLILFDEARSKRSSAFYDRANVTSETEYKALLDEAKKLVGLIKNRIKDEFPEFGKEI